MSEKFYVVSEEELEELVSTARYLEAGNTIERVDSLYRTFTMAEAACRAREIMFIAVASQDGQAMWKEIKR